LASCQIPTQSLSLTLLLKTEGENKMVSLVGHSKDMDITSYYHRKNRFSFGKVNLFPIKLDLGGEKKR